MTRRQRPNHSNLTTIRDDNHEEDGLDGPDRSGSEDLGDVDSEKVLTYVGPCCEAYHSVGGAVLL